MEFLYGLLTAVVFFIALLFFFYLGTRYEKKKPPNQVEEDEEKKRDMQKLHSDFLKVMNYNEDVARQRKKVT
jgi:H+/gluconate symporter-like permease